MPETRSIKRRIKSIAATKKITKAMELVAASKMRRATVAALQGRPYAEAAWRLLLEMSTEKKSAHPLLKIRPVKKIALILVSSDRGLCGGYNSQLIRRVLEELHRPERLARIRNGGLREEPKNACDVSIDIITIGKKGEEVMKRLGKNVVASFISMSDRPTILDLRPIAKISIDEFKKENYDRVVVAYTDFVSPVRQVPKFRELLPISSRDFEKVLHEIHEEDVEETKKFEYIFEPSTPEVLEEMLERLVETQLYQMFLEAQASEQSARMLAMRNATDAATEMQGELTLLFNRARQAAITQEIAEISSGKASLEG